MITTSRIGIQNYNANILEFVIVIHSLRAVCYNFLIHIYACYIQAQTSVCQPEIELHEIKQTATPIQWRIIFAG